MSCIGILSPTHLDRISEVELAERAIPPCASRTGKRWCCTCHIARIGDLQFRMLSWPESKSVTPGILESERTSVVKIERCILNSSHIRRWCYLWKNDTATPQVVTTEIVALLRARHSWSRTVGVITIMIVRHQVKQTDPYMWGKRIHEEEERIRHCSHARRADWLDQRLSTGD